MNIPYLAIEHGLSLLPRKMATDEARLMLYAIGLQESRFKHRKQIKGPAKGFWQFESAGGVKGVMNHSSSRKHAKAACAALSIEFNQSEIHKALEHNDALAAAFARLLLWTDPQPLPCIGEENESWDYYIRNWRPGKPHHHTWNDMYTEARAGLYCD